MWVGIGSFRPLLCSTTYPTQYHTLSVTYFWGLLGCIETRSLLCLQSTSCLWQHLLSASSLSIQHLFSTLSSTFCFFFHPSICSINFSDHAPVFVDIDLLRPTSKQWIWKLKDSLIQMPEVTKEVSRKPRQYFSTNIDPEFAPMMVWEAHKGYIRGSSNKIGSHIKKARSQQIVDLLGKIRSREAIHKQSLAAQTPTDLTALQNQLQSLALFRAKALIVKCRQTL